jgi:hypothetical protein
MERSILLPGLLASAMVLAETAPDFSIADHNGDGVLSIKEVQVSLPTIEIADTNADGLLNQAEAEEAIKGLNFSANGFAGGTGLVSEFEYRLILKTLGLKEETHS